MLDHSGWLEKLKNLKTFSLMGASFGLFFIHCTNRLFSYHLFEASQAWATPEKEVESQPHPPENEKNPVNFNTKKLCFDYHFLKMNEIKEETNNGKKARMMEKITLLFISCLNIDENKLKTINQLLISIKIHPSTYHSNDYLVCFEEMRKLESILNEFNFKDLIDLKNIFKKELLEQVEFTKLFYNIDETPENAILKTSLNVIEKINNKALRSRIDFLTPDLQVLRCMKSFYEKQAPRP